MECVEVWRAQRGQHEQERDRQRNDDRRRGTGLNLECIRLALDLLRARDGRLEVGEQRSELPASGSLDEDGGGEHVEQRLRDAVARHVPGLAAAERRGGDEPKLLAQRFRAAFGEDGDGLLHARGSRLEELAQHAHRLEHRVLAADARRVRAAADDRAHEGERADGSGQGERYETRRR